MTLTREHIRREVGDAYFQRGKAYFEQGRVLECRSEPTDFGRHVLATTAGSGGVLYRQDIAIVIDGDEVDIDGECSCPLVYNCKHVAAACCASLAAAAQDALSGPPVGAAAARWLESFAAAGAGIPAPPAEEFVIYVFDLVATRGREDREELRLEARHVRRRGKEGGLTRGRSVDVRDFDQPYRRVAAAVVPLDLEIAELLAGGLDYFARMSVRGRRGYAAVMALLDSGRCHWESGSQPPLTRGPPRVLRLNWAPQSAGGLVGLHAEVDGGGLLLPTDPPLYLDPLMHVIGPLDAAGLTPAQLALLGSAPILAPAQAAALTSTLVSRFATLPLPPPVANVRENVGQSPVPTLRVRGSSSANPPQPSLVLEFRYGPDRVPGWPLAPTSMLQAADGMVRLVRDAAAERAAHARLTALGFLLTAQSMAGGSDAGAEFVAAGVAEFEIASQWSRLLHVARAELEREGWEIAVEETFPLRFEAGEWIAELDSSAGRPDWFALSFHVQVGQTRLPLIELLQPILGADWSQLPATVSVPLGGQRYLDVPAARLRPLLDVLRDLCDRPPAADARWHLPRTQVTLLQELETQGVSLHGGQAWRELAARLRDFDGIRTVTPDPALAAELRPYQQRGVDWLQFLRDYGFNGILADDMGLGKTVQTLAHLLIEKRAGRLTAPALVVAPTSLMGNWRREAARFAPTLTVEVLHGQTRHARYAHAETADVVLTTYPLLPRDADRLQALEFHSVILDEAQVIKNPRAKAAQVVRTLQARHRLCLTGTPLENHLGELWALFDFLMPGFLGDAETFRRSYRVPIETHGDLARQALLARRVAPFMLRRTKQAVAAELPPKTEIVQRIELDPAQAELYENIRIAVDHRVREAISRQGLARSHLTVLDALLKLRQVCCDPRLLRLEGLAARAPSAKLEVLLALLEELLAEGRRVLLFSQFTSMLALIEQALVAREIAFTKLTGKTRHRDAAIERFRQGEVSVFLISLKAGGVGLNLPEADTVIHYDPWWNPAVETQATDRAHRIGQTQPVFVYKLIAEHSVEEKMLELQARKRALAAGVHVGAEGGDGPLFDPEMIARLFEPLDTDTEHVPLTDAASP